MSSNTAELLRALNSQIAHSGALQSHPLEPIIEEKPQNAASIP